MKRAFLIGALALLLAACEFSLAGDITPPPEAIISTQRTPSPVELPASPPDAAAGAPIFAQSCALCHGASGLGDGSQAGQLPFFPAAIGDPDVARDVSPEDWFRIITEGRLTRYMPPFAGSLSVQERWDVLAHVYSLSLDAEALERGEVLYIEHSAQVEALLDGDLLSAERSLIAQLDLGDEDTIALTAYLQARALGIELGQSAATPQPETEELVAAGAGGVFTGSVEYGSEGALPQGLTAMLSGFDHTEQSFTAIVEIATDGTFIFEDVPLAEGRIFFVQVEYQGQIYFSEFIEAAGEQNSFELPIIIYETTSDTSQLAVEGIQLVYDLTDAGTLRVVQSVTISNLGDRAVVPDEGEPVLHYLLPAEASGLVFQEGVLGDRYVADEQGFGDLRAVLPGQGSYQLLFAYELPYNGGLTYQIYIDLPTRSLLALLPETVSMDSPDFAPAGTQQIDARTYSLYTADAGYLPGDTVIVALRGGSANAPAILRDPSLLAGLAALLVAVGALWVWVRRTPANRDAVLDEIVALDARYERGDIREAAYQKRRAALKEQLRGLVKSKK
jgi:mono/diheme cytochrome c family protein